MFKVNLVHNHVLITFFPCVLISSAKMSNSEFSLLFNSLYCLSVSSTLFLCLCSLSLSLSHSILICSFSLSASLFLYLSLSLYLPHPLSVCPSHFLLSGSPPPSVGLRVHQVQSLRLRAQ